jgi:hypothetical protein
MIAHDDPAHDAHDDRPPDMLCSTEYIDLRLSFRTLSTTRYPVITARIKQIKLEDLARGPLAPVPAPGAAGDLCFIGVGQLSYRYLTTRTPHTMTAASLTCLPSQDDRLHTR